MPGVKLSILLLMSVFAQSLFAFVRSNLVPLTLFSTRHIRSFYLLKKIFWSIGTAPHGGSLCCIAPLGKLFCLCRLTHCFVGRGQ